ncbi:MAG TPA: sodium:calcium antiporter [Persephonella sp.]|uniref:Sodium/calcium exchanger n=1 Tax=Persephonella marina (strain DSM 14350 / EX-H1) TaxID=123214 RepID=C0QT25_PERMH|nr:MULTISPECIES: sodium:calcium antiporter [Persephonella]ACO03643.1 sodium/calcium exchanger [Persephonella marina EX-H1]HCB70541.1 sodium:calcium antiporter [Persephonella sp.]
MILDILLLVLGLGIILVAAELFTNGIETIGHRLQFSQNFTGSVLAAVGTALPESILPVIAIIFFADNAGHEIGIGAILGAPFMLSTLAIPLIGLTVLLRYFIKKGDLSLNLEEVGLRRDIVFFLFAYSVALFIVPYEIYILKVFTAFFLLSLYVLYVYLTLRGESEDMEETEHLYFAPKNPHPHILIAVVQSVFALVIMVIGAHLFVHGIEHISTAFGFSPLLFSLLLAPVATELPEKVNSVLWVFRGKDTLAVGNVSGAMVFQSTIPVSFGIIFTDWNIEGLALVSGVFAIIAGFLVLVLSYVNKKLVPFGFSLGMIFYVTYFYLTVTSMG